jgi:diacylglycerol kinase
MISIGIVDLVIAVILLIIATVAVRRRLYTRLYLVLAILLVFMVERLVPGTLNALGNAVHSIDRINDLGPHLTINPIISFK